jgi:hypothetical protein
MESGKQWKLRKTGVDLISENWETMETHMEENENP